MSRLVEFPLDEGGSVLVEVDGTSDGRVTRGLGGGDAVTKAGATLEQALGRLGPAIKGIVGEMREMAERPDEVAVAFSVKLSADANVIIARSGGEANFTVALKWTREVE